MFRFHVDKDSLESLIDAANEPLDMRIHKAFQNRLKPLVKP